MSLRIASLVCFSVLVADAEDNAEAMEKYLRKQREYCGIVTHCGLPAPSGECPDSLAKGIEKVPYDEERCRVPKLLHQRGVGTSGRLGYQVYRFLGQEYQITYEIEEALPVSVPRLNFLLSDLPFAAKLLNHFEKGEYEAEYLDGNVKRQFKGRKGKNLTGQARLISGSTDEQRLFYFGFGIAEVLWWRLKGYALMDFRYSPAKPGNKELDYKMEIIVFPGNAVVNVIMNMGMFQKIVYGKISDVLTDISNAARKLESKGIDADEPGWSAEDRRKIQAFHGLP